MVASSFMRIDSRSKDLLVHQGAEIKRGVATAGTNGGTAQRHQTVR
jgi:hypothetical protein